MQKQQQQRREAQISAFIAARGVTPCPPATQEFLAAYAAAYAARCEEDERRERARWDRADAEFGRAVQARAAWVEEFGADAPIPAPIAREFERARARIGRLCGGDE